MLVAESPHPATSGGRRRSASIEAALAQRGRVVLLAANDPGGGPDVWSRAVASYRQRRASRILRARDVTAGIVRRRHTILVRALAAHVDGAFEAVLAEVRPDIVVLGRPFVRPFAEIARAHGARVVVDADEWMGRLHRQVVKDGGSWRARGRALIEAYTLDPMERGWYRDADQVWVSSEREAEHFARWLNRERVHVVPNVAPAVDEEPGPAEDIRAVCFVGSYGHAPNEAAALHLIRDVMPAIRSKGGPRRLILVGRDPTRAMLSAADAETVITGEVPDPTVLLREAGVLVAPIRSGGGTRVKILEAMAIGVPVVSTSVSGIPELVRDGETGRLVPPRDPAALATAIEATPADRAQARRLAAAGRARLEGEFDLWKTTRRLHALFGCAECEGAPPKGGSRFRAEGLAAQPSLAEVAP